MLTNLENRLFKDWSSMLDLPETKFFIKDGIVNSDEWTDTPFNVLFLLKEVNGGDCEWDEREYLNNYYCDEKYIKTHSPTIDTLILWLYGIFHFSSKTPWEEVISSQTQKQNEWLLRQIALVNVKKTPGEAVADMKDVDSFFKNYINKMNLCRQLEMYKDADLVICGGTAYYLQQLSPKYSEGEWKITHTGIKYLRVNNTIYLDFVHPLARAPKNFVFYTLIEAIEEINEVEKLGWEHVRELEIL